jgi:hypothetical protein
MAAAARPDRGLLVRRDDVLALAQPGTLEASRVQVEDPGGLGGEAGVAGEDPGAVLPRLDGILGSQRRTVAVDTSATRPLASSSSRSSARLQRPSGTPRVAGSSQAIALTSATTAAANTRGRPERGRSRKPAYPWVQNRLRHLRTVLGVTPTRRAISVLGRPAAAPARSWPARPAGAARPATVPPASARGAQLPAS